MAHVTLQSTRSEEGHGGGIAFTLKSDLVDSSWGFSHISATNVDAPKGSGGDLFFSTLSFDGMQVDCLNWTVQNAYTGVSGGVWAVQAPDFRESPRGGVVRFRSLQAHNVTAGGDGAILSLLSNLPFQVPWREHGSFCTWFCTCDAFKPFRDQVIPVVVYPAVALATNWKVSLLSAQAGALASITNAEVSFRSVSIHGARASYSGSLWRLAGFTDLDAANVRATGLGATHGAILYQSQSPANITIRNATLQLESEEGTIPRCLCRGSCPVRCVQHKSAMPTRFRRQKCVPGPRQGI